MYKIFNSKGCAAIAIAFVIINILVTVVIITSFVNITINQTKQAGKIFDKYYSNIEFEGDIMSMHQIKSKSGKPTMVVCVRMTKTNTKQFDHSNNVDLHLKIENGIAALPIENCNKNNLQRFTTIQVNKDGNRLVIFGSEDGEELKLPLTYKGNVSVWDMNICF